MYNFRPLNPFAGQFTLEQHRKRDRVMIIPRGHCSHRQKSQYCFSPENVRANPPNSKPPCVIRQCPETTSQRYKINHKYASHSPKFRTSIGKSPVSIAAAAMTGTKLSRYSSETIRNRKCAKNYENTCQCGSYTSAESLKKATTHKSNNKIEKMRRRNRGETEGTRNGQYLRKMRDEATVATRGDGDEMRWIGIVAVIEKRGSRRNAEIPLLKKQQSKNKKHEKLKWAGCSPLLIFSPSIFSYFKSSWHVTKRPFGAPSRAVFFWPFSGAGVYRGAPVVSLAALSESLD